MKARLPLPSIASVPKDVQARIVTAYEDCSIEDIRRRFHMSAPRIRAVLKAHGVLREAQ